MNVRQKFIGTFYNNFLKLFCYFVNHIEFTNADLMLKTFIEVYLEDNNY